MKIFNNYHSVTSNFFEDFWQYHSVNVHYFNWTFSTVTSNFFEDFWQYHSINIHYFNWTFSTITLIYFVWIVFNILCSFSNIYINQRFFIYFFWVGVISFLKNWNSNHLKLFFASFLITIRYHTFDTYFILNFIYYD